jgi:hypothetical protein
MDFLKYKIKKKSNIPHFLCVNVLLHFGGSSFTGNPGRKINVYLPSLMMKVPDHLYV